MYTQRVPHPLVRSNHEFDSGTTLVNAQTTPTNGTTSSPILKTQSHHLGYGYVVLAVGLVIVLLSVVGLFVAHRRVPSFLPCTARRTKRRDVKRAPALQAQQKDSTRFTDEFNLLNARNGSLSSRTPTSPSSEGPSTPVDGEECGNSKGAPNAKNDCSFVPIPIIVHSPRQTHQTTFLTGPDVSSQEFDPPMIDEDEFFEESLPRASHGSAIRPYGLPLQPVPEESTGMASFSFPHTNMDEETL